MEVLIRAPLDQRWDLRFSRIRYLPKADDAEPQRVKYETRIGAGLAIRGTGESVATRIADDGSAVSSLKFASEDRLSLIREGAGYWRYIPTEDGLRFLTWYDYQFRFGALGRLLDRVFRPLMGWATAWSFDRMRLCAERDVQPEVSLRFAAIHALCRVGIAAVWVLAWVRAQAAVA